MFADESGNIENEKLKTVMKSLGQDASDAELDAMIKEVDTDGKGAPHFLRNILVTWISSLLNTYRCESLLLFFNTGLLHPFLLNCGEGRANSASFKSEEWENKLNLRTF